MHAVGYFVEGARRDGAKRSIGEQNRTFLEFCARQGFEVAGTFVDTGAQESDDAGFKQMVHYLSRPDRGFMLVAVDGLGALGSDLGKAAMRLLTIENTGVQVLCSHSGRELAKELVTAWADRGESTTMGEKVRSAMRRKAVRGEVLGRPPYGYRVGPRHRLELVPEEAVVVRYIFRLYLQEELGIRRIAGQLNEEGVLTRRGGPWSMVSVRDLLRNRTYLGTYSRFGVRVPGSHPALVSTDDFRRVHDRLQSHHGGERKRTVAPYLLSGLVYCGRCGNRMIGVSRRQKWTTRAGEERSSSYRYYQCESRTNQNMCDYNTQRAADLEERIRALIAEGSAGLSRMPRAGNATAYVIDAITQVERVEGRIRRSKRRLEEIVADAAHGHISLERMRLLGMDVAKEHGGLDDELGAARARLALQQSEEDRRLRLTELRQRLAGEWDGLSFDELQAGLREVVDRVEVDGENCRIFTHS